MKHIKNIEEGLVRIKINLLDDKNKKSSIKLNSFELKKKRRYMGSIRVIAKVPKILNLYSEVASQEEVQYARGNVKENVYNRISTLSLLAIEQAYRNNKLEDDTLKEFLDHFWHKERKEKSLENLRVDKSELKQVLVNEKSAKLEKEENVK